MTPTRELAAGLDQDDVILLPRTNIELARYIGGTSETPESDGNRLIAADELIVGSDFP